MSSLEDEGYKDLKKRTATSVIWSVARVLWSTGASFVIFVVLARLLGPADFGLFALAALFVDISRIIASAGLGDAVVRQAELTEELADTAFWANVGLSLSVALAVMGLAPLYGEMVNNPQVVDVLRALAFTLPVAALGGIHGARLTRDYKHKLFAVQTAITSIISGLAGIGAAFYGLGVWSLVVQAWTGAILGVGMAWSASRWVPGLRFSMSAFKSIATFSVSMTINQLLWLMMGRVGDLIIARAYGTAELGRYRIAWRMYELIGQIALAPIGSVAMLTFSKLQHDMEKLKAAYLRILSGAAIIAFPLILGYASLSNEIVEALFSAQWQGAGEISSVLALMIVPFVFNYISPGVLAAINRGQSIMKVAITQLVLTIAFTMLFVPYGLLAVAGAYVLRNYVTLPLQQGMLKKHTGIKMIEAAKVAVAPLSAAFAMAASVWLLKPYIANMVGQNLWATIAIGVAVGGIVYIGSIFLFGRSVIAPYLHMVQPYLSRFRKS
ncbi:lipopolysaccharide biosynthesis protein [Asticcacaulis machinosus]|uniref:Lipopolysaccharide biosynthesis protein n=1 Tax=Asticcacaulis machinosus TaxID=2984211 RepID=A0ABT5HJL3_9CAUL|nr:lipopolysaccharide biosynthesis protein [Asticcacaulis machinosus]MDC7676440.1 lipopolysaccharide biosynthesis protein [Asticcacaulis machinosus]